MVDQINGRASTLKAKQIFVKCGLTLCLLLILSSALGFSQATRNAQTRDQGSPPPDTDLARPDFVLENLTPASRAFGDKADRFGTLRDLAREKNWTALAREAQNRLALSDEPFLHYWLGVARLQLGDFVHAAIELRTAERLGLKAAVLHKSLGVAYYGLRQYTLFQAQMQKAIDAEPGDGEPYHYLGRYYELDLNDFSQALSYFDQALARDPEDVKSRHFRAVCLEMLDRHDEAEQTYRAAIEMVDRQGKPYSWPFERLAILLLGREPKLALSFAQRAVDLEPSRVENRLLLAKIYDSLDRPEEALPQLQEAIRYEPNNRSIRYVLFRIYRKLGRKEEAARELAMHEKLKAVYGTSQP